MLLQLNIKNFALIEELSIEFEKGFNVLTGETGSGKSILIDAINFVLGSKFNKNLIRTGENKTYVEAIFTIENENTKEALKELEIDYEDFLILSRETFKSGKTIAKVNGKSLILNQLKVISQTLIDIHGQHENQNLLDSSKHIQYLDYYGRKKLECIMDKYREKFYEVQSIESRIREIEQKKGESQKKIDFIKYQIEDIEKAKLKVGEDDELEEKYLMLSNAEKLDKMLYSCHNMLYGTGDGYNSIFDNLNIVIKNLKSIEDKNEKIKRVANGLEESYYIIEQSIHDIGSIKDSIYYDQSELEFINERLYTLDNYKKKYGKTIKDILEYKNNIEKEYTELVDGIEIIKKLNLQKNKVQEVLVEFAEELHKIRSEIAKELQKKIKEELNYIGLEKSTIHIDVKKLNKFNDLGFDSVMFYISTNPGEPLKPLDSVVSGGELSRIMLALKTVFFHKDAIPTVIFDEIDTGISGRVAQSVAEKMYLISNSHQVFCITHLPQIASMSDNNYLVVKEVIDNKTYTNVKKMNFNEKLLAIAKMIGGSEVTKLTMDNSEEMIKLAQEKKSKLA